MFLAVGRVCTHWHDMVAFQNEWFLDNFIIQFGYKMGDTRIWKCECVVVVGFVNVVFDIVGGVLVDQTLVGVVVQMKSLIVEVDLGESEFF